MIPIAGGRSVEMQGGYLQCVARSYREGEWEAICLDFDLAVQGATFEEVQANLNEAIGAYAAAALEEPEPSRSYLLTRRAPFLTRLAWTWPLVVRSIFKKRDDHHDDSSVGFAVSCPG